MGLRTSLTFEPEFLSLPPCIVCGGRVNCPTGVIASIDNPRNAEDLYRHTVDLIAVSEGMKERIKAHVASGRIAAVWDRKWNAWVVGVVAWVRPSDPHRTMCDVLKRGGPVVWMTEEERKIEEGTGR